MEATRPIAHKPSAREPMLVVRWPRASSSSGATGAEEEEADAAKLNKRVAVLPLRVVGDGSVTLRTLPHARRVAIANPHSRAKAANVVEAWVLDVELEGLEGVFALTYLPSAARTVSDAPTTSLFGARVGDGGAVGAFRAFQESNTVPASVRKWDVQQSGKERRAPLASSSSSSSQSQSATAARTTTSDTETESVASAASSRRLGRRREQDENVAGNRGVASARGQDAVVVDLTMDDDHNDADDDADTADTESESESERKRVRNSVAV